jgi:condensin complex subunit 2
VFYLQLEYSKRRKRIDVHALKAFLWEGFLTQASLGSASLKPASPSCAEPVELQCVFSKIRDGKAGKLEDITPHACFLCTLVLANEHNLRLYSEDSKVFVAQDQVLAA